MTKSVYISYSRRSNFDFINKLMDAAESHTDFVHAIPREQGVLACESLMSLLNQSEHTLQHEEDELDRWAIEYDEKSMAPEGSIRVFIEELSEGDKIIILLSSGYFQSPYCLTELSQIYHKRAHELMPIVVFVDGFRSADVMKAETLSAWCNLHQSKRFIEEPELVLAWLLGEIEEETGNPDRLIFKASQESAVQKVLAAVACDNKALRFKHQSQLRKQDEIENSINKILGNSNPDLRKAYEDLKKFPMETDRDGTLFLLGKDLKKVCAHGRLLVFALNTIDDWLQELDRTALLENRARNILVGEVRDVVGWLLFLAVDDAKLHCLIHRLNWKNSHAQLNLFDENESSVQVMVSSISQVNPRYRYVESEETSVSSNKKVVFRLRGRGELDLKESGACVDNFCANYEKEQAWMDILGDIYRQTTDHFNEHKSLASLEAALSSVLRKNKDLFLRFVQDEVEMKKTAALRARLGEKCPGIQQVVVSDTFQTAQSYYRQDVSSGQLDHLIHEIYAKLNRMCYET